MSEKEKIREHFGGSVSYYNPCIWTFKKWSMTRENWDHDHCEFCLQKITDLDISDSIKEGWTNQDEGLWICESCFEEFKETYQWKINNA